MKKEKLAGRKENGGKTEKKKWRKTQEANTEMR